MAATFNKIQRHDLGGMDAVYMNVTADAATAVYTFSEAAAGAGPPKLVGLTVPVKTTGAASAITATYVEATGVLTIGGLTATDVIEFTVFLW